MNRTALVIIAATTLLLCLMLFSFGSIAANGNKSTGTKKGSAGPPTTQVTRSNSVSANRPTTSEIKQANNKIGARNRVEGSDPDMPSRIHGTIDRETYLRLRDEYTALRRGIEPGRPFDPQARGRAIRQMEDHEALRDGKNTFLGRLTRILGISSTAGAAWTSLGPAPLSNGESLSGGSISVSGRVTAVVVDPTNSNNVYVGTAQGGVWRSIDDGSTWMAIFDSAQSLAIGALALAPSSPTTLYVGTGEFNACGDCFFGAGLYRIDNADTAATLVGPINPSETIGNLTYNVFNGRAISKILVHPTDPATIFVATAQGIGGSGANSFSMVPPMATRGVFRSTNATAEAEAITFTKLVVDTDFSLDTPATGDVDIADMVVEPGNPNNVLAAVIGRGFGAGVFRTTNALAANPNFVQVLALAPGLRAALAINKADSNVTVYAATGGTPNATPGCTSATAGVNSGIVFKSTNGGTSWSELTGGGGFCGAQCFYDIAIAVNPNNANEVYLGGNARGTCSDGMKKSTDGGANFIRDDNGLHADTHSLFYDSIGNIYTGNDGGVWKRSSSASAGSAWTNLNNAPLNTLQFESVALHPIDRNFTIGGTQDNGTEYQVTSPGNWSNAEGGDGGFALIDQSSTDLTNVTMYHTFFNLRSSQIGFDRTINTACLQIKDSWPTRGDFGGSSDLTPVPCDGTAAYIKNGINRNDIVLFFAPMALGPGTPNTVYFGTDRLYRSIDRGDSMTVVSQAPISGSPVSAIGISPQDDNYRIIGMKDGTVWATSTGSSTLVNITNGSFPANPNGSTTNKFVGRAVIDPQNKNVAYVTFSFFAPASQGVWKIANLGAASGPSPAPPVWTAVANGIPSIPINAFAVDPLNSNNLFAGTDIGVYDSTDGGATWNPYGTGLPRVAVFDLAIQNPNRLVRIATHGRGIWEIPIGANPTPTPTPTPMPLRIDNVIPPAGRTSGGQQTVLSGEFAGLSSMTMGGTPASFFYTNGSNDTSKITVTTPAHAVGAVDIVLTPTSGSTLTKANAFAYLPTVFTDDMIVVGETTAKAQHILELRQAVDAMRAVAGLSGAPWNDSSLAPGDPIRAVHITDLRTFLDDAATRLGFSTSPYTDPGLTTGFVIKRIHIEELRQRIRTIAG